MASGSERRVVTPSEYPQGGAPPYAAGAPNPYSPVSMENRITGNGSGRRRMTEAQPLPGSSYGYGSPEAEARPAPPVFPGAASFGYPQCAPPVYPPPPAPPYAPAPFGGPEGVRAQGYAAPEAASGYVPRHSRPALEPLREIQPIGGPQAADPWETLGWKAPKAVLDGGAAAGGYGAPTPYGYDAYREPSAPYAASTPPWDAGGVEARPTYAPEAYPPSYGSMEPAVTESDSRPYPPVESSPAAPYSREGYAAPRDPREGAAPHAGTPDGHGAPPPAPPEKRESAADGRNARRSMRDWWRLALIAALSLALLFCVVEMARIVRDLMANEQEVKERNDAYHARTGADVSAAGGVELLPAGQTYAPAETAAPLRTPTPEPKIAQNDPLIGVVDNGGSAADVQTSSPTDAPATRARLAYYPDNQLLNVDPTFADLRSQNEDVVGTLTIDGVLSETLVQRNNTFYLTHNARGAFGTGGAVFVDEGCVLTRPPENLLLRGQTTVAGKQFEPLLQYEAGGEDFVSGHGVVACRTVYENARYVVFAVLRADSQPSSSAYFNYAGHPTFQTDAQMLAYVQAAKQRSLYRIDVGVRAADRLLTLATLPSGGDTTCLVILCRMLRSGESAGHIQTD